MSALDTLADAGWAAFPDPPQIYPPYDGPVPPSIEPGVPVP